MVPLRVFIGHNPKETIAYHVLAQSILSRASQPVAIIPIVRNHLKEFHPRERGPLDSTDFSITRFLVPFLSDYSGYSIYMDCDMLCKTDLHELPKFLEPGKSVWVVKHDYIPTKSIDYKHAPFVRCYLECGCESWVSKSCLGSAMCCDRHPEKALWPVVRTTDEIVFAGTKMSGRHQTVYSRKNWSSLMVFDNHACWGLTPDYVNAAAGLALHQFEWLQYSRIGSLPMEYNWLVGEYAYNPLAKILHYTLGGPWLPGCPPSQHNQEWLDEHSKLQCSL